MYKPLLIFVVKCCLIVVGCHNVSSVAEIPDSNVVKQNQKTGDIKSTPNSTIKVVQTVNPTSTPEYQVKTNGKTTGLFYNDHPKLGEHYKPAWIEAEKSDNGYEPFCVQTKIKGKKIEKCGYQNADGKVLIKPVFDTVLVFSEGLAGACPESSQLCGYINEQGQLAIKAEYQFVDVFSEGLAGVGIVDVDYGKYGYINKEGKVVVKLHYTDGEPFKNGIAKVKLAGTNYCITKEGQEVKCPE